MANRFKTDQKPRTSGLPSFRVFRSVGLLVLSVAALTMWGCSSSSPRFTGSTKKSTSTPVAPPKTSQHSEPLANETAADPEKKSESGDERVTTGTRDFRTEKNAAIKPLDQSRMMREISKYMGAPYKRGGTDGQGFDCSGYAMTVYKNSVGVALPRTSAEQSQLGDAVSFDDLKFGDLLFFNTTGESASHVGIYLGDDLFAHASVSLGVTISSLQSSYYKNRFEKAKRMIGN